MKKTTLLAFVFGLGLTCEAKAQVVWVKPSQPSIPVTSPTSPPVSNNVGVTDLNIPATVTTDVDSAYMGGGMVVNNATPPGGIHPGVTSDVSITPIKQSPPSTSATGNSSYSFGNDIPLSVAVTMIAPSDKHVILDSAVHDVPVSWGGSAPWLDTLSTVVAHSGNKLSVSGDTIFIAPQVTATASISPVPTQQPTQVSTSAMPPPPVDPVYTAYKQKKPGAQIVEPATTPKADDSEIKMTSANGLAPASKSDIVKSMPNNSYAPASGGTGIYYAARRQDLQTILQIWATANGWSVQYDAQVHYSLQQPVTLNGDFTECARTLVHSIRATPKPRVKFYVGNHVIRIFNYDDAS